MTITPAAAPGPGRPSLAVRLGLVDLLGLLGLGWAVAAAAVGPGPVHAWVVPAALGLQVAGRLVTVPLRIGTRRVWSSGLATTATVLGFALAPAAWVVLAVTAVVAVRQVVARRPAFKALFNTAANTAPVALAALLVDGLAPTASPWVHAAVLVGAGLVYDVGNELMITPVVAAATGDRVWPTLRVDLPETAVTSLLTSALAALVVLDVAGVPTSVVAIAVALAVTVVNHRRRLDHETTAAALPRLAAASRRIASLDATETVTELAERAVDLFAADDVEVWLLEWPGSPGNLRWVRTGPLQGRWAIAPAYGLGEVDPTRVLRVPLLGDSELLGEVRMSFGRVPAPSDAEKDVLSVYSSAAAGAVEHARTHLVQRQLARTDPLTGLPNRLALREGLEQLLPAVLDRSLALAARASLLEAGVTAGMRAAGGPAAVILLDLDHFRQVNDTFGTETGDALLREVAARLRSTARPGDLVARLNGDQFCLVLGEVRDVPNARALAAHVLGSVAEIRMVGGLDLPVRASAGVALSPDDGTTLDELLRRAALALAAAKESVAHVQVFDLSMDARGAERTQLLDELAAGLGAGEVTVLFQPRVGTATGEVVAVEAVPCWAHPVLGVLPAARWAGQASASPLAVPLARHVLAAAIGQAARWRRETGREVGVAVDVAARCLLSAGFPGDVAYLLVQHGVPGRCLTLQVTEQPDGPWEALARGNVDALQGAGVKVGITSFGRGAASMTSLARADADAVTLDGRVVGAALNDTEARAVVAGTVAIAHHRGMAVGASGVQSAGDHDLMRDLGIDTAQGRHHGEPMPADDMARLLRATADRPAR